ncbi:hypothetical protein AYO40_01640 [Planctomycetaceae bacterium SCGC AG-212-D15]|nr:hypothetical protein AYO40_01640 [Planctomycetaceae bacterium SCGC AG-212-D15]
MLATPAPLPSSPPPPKPRTLFLRWRQWLNRLDDEFAELLRNRRHFRALQAIWNANLGRIERAEIGRWMVQGYVAYACTTIRRLAEPPSNRRPPSNPRIDPRLCISLIILLREIQTHAVLFTRARLRNIYVRANPDRQTVFERVADRDFNAVARNSRASSLPSRRIDQDVMAICRATRSIDRFVNKTIAHHERHRRRVGRPIRYGEIDRTIDVLLECFKRYHLFVVGRGANPERDDDDVDIRPDLARLWPEAVLPPEWRDEVGIDERL